MPEGDGNYRRRATTAAGRGGGPTYITAGQEEGINGIRFIWLDERQAMLPLIAAGQMINVWPHWVATSERRAVPLPPASFAAIRSRCTAPTAALTGVRDGAEERTYQ